MCVRYFYAGHLESSFPESVSALIDNAALIWVNKNRYFCMWFYETLRSRVPTAECFSRGCFSAAAGRPGAPQEGDPDFGFQGKY
jgi:hypothetical protein